MTSKNYSFNELVEMSSTALDTAVEADGTLNYMLPTHDNIVAGDYESEILKVEICFEDSSSKDSDETEDSVNTPILNHIEVYHKLTNRNGYSDTFRFNIYKEYDGIVRWAKTMKDYGFIGDLNEVTGTKENVVIAFGQKSRYAYIKSRSLIALPQPTPADIKDDMPDDPPEAITQKPSKEERLQKFFEDDEDDEDEDYLNDEDNFLEDEDDNILDEED